MKKLITLIAVLSFGISAASAASLEDLQVKELAKKAAGTVTGYTTAVSLNVHYVGSSTQAVVFVSSGIFATFVPGPAATRDLNFSLAAAAYDTMGELCDAIDVDDDYECSLVDVKRDDPSYMTQQSAISNSDDAKAAAGFSVLIDSGSANDSNDFQDGSAFVLRLGITPRSGKSVVLKYCTGNASGTTDTLRVWGKLAKFLGVSDGVTRNDTTLVLQAAIAEDTDKTIGNVYSGDNFLEFAPNEHVVIGSYDNDTAQTGATNNLVCSWDEK